MGETPATPETYTYGGVAFTLETLSEPDEHLRWIMTEHAALPGMDFCKVCHTRTPCDVVCMAASGLARSARLAAAGAEHAALRSELREQWESNHAEHCDNVSVTWDEFAGLATCSHESDRPHGCSWPFPAAILSTEPGEHGRALLEAAQTVAGALMLVRSADSLREKDAIALAALELFMERTGMRDESVRADDAREALARRKDTGATDGAGGRR